MPPKKTRDDRFARLQDDPRYRLPSNKQNRGPVDKRFSRMFADDDEDFNRRAKVDKYGRRVDRSKSQNLKGRLAPASEEEDEQDEEEEDEEIEEPKKGKGKARKIEVASPSGLKSEEEVDDEDEDEDVVAELRRVEGYDPARQGGFSSSDDSSSDEEDSLSEAELPDEEEVAPVPLGEVSKRIAVVNLDWDNIRAADILAVANSFVPAEGRIESCAVYPSEFGKERLEREELEGPPREIFAGKKGKDAGSEEDEEESDEEEDEKIRKRLQKGDQGEEFDSTALRRYQLDRLRYFYAVLTCSSSAVAQNIYSNLDGREYLTTANFFDLRFIPDETSFEDDKPREIVKKLPPGYKPNDFVTEALTHSKVKLTWDADDASRKEIQKRAFSRAEVDENDLRAYIGGSSSESDGESDVEGGKDGKKEAERQKMRALLGLGAEKKEKKTTDGDRHVGDMQITFTSGLSGDREGRGVFENSPPRDETTRERYVRKEKERKAKRKEKAKAKRIGDEAPAGSDSENEQTTTIPPTITTEQEDPEADPFDDPFFNSEKAPSKSQKQKQSKADRIKKREAKQLEAEKSADEKKRLELLMMNDEASGTKHFDMRALAKAAKLKNKKGKKGKKDQLAEQEGGQGGDDAIETADPRFARLYESHEFAIDPTNPRFVRTEGMEKILEEGRKRRRGGEEDGVELRGGKEGKKARKGVEDGEGEDTRKLLERVKARSRV